MTTRSVAGPGGPLAVTHGGSGPAVLLLHGWMGDQADLAPLSAELAADHHVILADLRGHGASQASAGPFTLDAFADDAAAVATGLGTGPVLAVGHSMGGAVALTLAGRYPQLVSGVVMVDSPWAVVPPGPELLARVAPLYDSEAEYIARRDRLRDARAALLPGPLGPAAAWPVAAQSYESLMRWDGPAALRGCPRPVHAVFADGSWQAVAPDLPRFPRLHASHIPGTGHWVQVERPEAVAAVIRSDIALDIGTHDSLRSAEQRSKFCAPPTGQEEAVPDDPLVLIHGAMHGAWCWRKMRGPLRQRGFDVHAISLTGLGDRAHLLRPDTSLTTHVEDVAALIEMEELTDVTIVGHSYGCMVGAGVVVRLPGRVRRMIYFDGPVPVDGESSIDVHPLGPGFVKRRTVVDGNAVLPPTDGSTLGLADDDLAWARRRLTAQPYGAVSTPLRLPPGWHDGVEQVYIRCLRGPEDPPRPYLSRVDPTVGWQYYEIRAGHDAMISAPDQLTELITAVCAGEAVSV